MANVFRIVKMALGGSIVAPLAAAFAIIVVVPSTGIAGGLWVPSDTGIDDFQGKLVSGSTQPHRIIGSSDLSEASGIAFDKGKNLWNTNYDTDTLTEFTKAQLKALKTAPAPGAAVVISDDVNDDLDEPEGLTFDKSGNLWVGVEGSGQVDEYTPAQLAANGSPTPNIILNGNSFSFSSPSLPVFDTAGNLWVVDEDIDNGQGGSGEIFKYTASQVAAFVTGNNDVDPVFGIANSEFQQLEGMAFDKKGNMWVADEGANWVYKFSASQAGGSGLSQNLTPVVILSSTSVGGGPCTQSIDEPYGIAVDKPGNLYVINSGATGHNCSGSLAKFGKKSIAVNGSPAPLVYISSNSHNSTIEFPGYPAFGPSIP